MDSVLKKEKCNGKLPFGFTPLWSSRSVSVAVSIVLLAQVTYYVTEVVGLSVGVAGTIFLVSKLFDGFTDLIVGFIIDKTNTKLGKARPYELFTIPLWIGISLLFSTPNFGYNGKIIYVFVIYTLINSVFATFLQSSETVYLGRAVIDDQQRGKVMALSGVIVMLISAIASIVLPQLMNTLGKQPGGWSKIGMVYAIPMATLGMIRFIFIKEQNIGTGSADSKQLGYRESVKILLQNKYIFIFAIIVTLANLVQYITSIVGTYYFNYILGDISLLSFVGMLGLIAPFILLLFPLAMRTIGAVNFVRIGVGVAIAGNLLKFIGQTNIAMLMIGQMLAGIGASTITMMNSVFILQCIDYGEYKTGKRVEGLPTALNNFASKLGSGIASIGIGAVMAAAGYVGSATQQTEAALKSIIALYTIIPAIICILMLIVLQLFDLEKKLPEMRRARE